MLVDAEVYISKLVFSPIMFSFFFFPVKQGFSNGILWLVGDGAGDKALVFRSINSFRLLLLIYLYVMFCFDVVLFYYFISVLLG